MAVPAEAYPCGFDHSTDHTANEEEVDYKIGDCVFRIYDLAISTTGEYYQAVGSNDAEVMSEISTAINRVNGVTERDLSFRMELVANNDLLLYDDGATDPYDNNDGAAIIQISTGVIDGIIGNGAYDIGHVFSTGGGGVAYLGVVCNNGYTRWGGDGSSQPHR